MKTRPTTTVIPQTSFTSHWPDPRNIVTRLLYQHMLESHHKVQNLILRLSMVGTFQSRAKNNIYRALQCCYSMARANNSPPQHLTIAKLLKYHTLLQHGNVNKPWINSLQTTKIISISYLFGVRKRFLTAVSTTPANVTFVATDNTYKQTSPAGFSNPSSVKTMA